MTPKWNCDPKKFDMVDVLWIILKYQLITNETLQKYKERKAKNVR